MQGSGGWHPSLLDLYGETGWPQEMIREQGLMDRWAFGSEQRHEGRGRGLSKGELPRPGDRQARD